MTYFIPVFALPIAAGDWTGLDPEAEAMEVIGGAVDTPTAELLQASFTNWWHLRAAEELTNSLGIPGLEFLSENVVLLDAPACHKASTAVSQLLEALSQETLPASLPSSLRQEELRAALPSVRVSQKVDEASGDVHAFLQFLVSLRWVLVRAEETDRRVLYYHPQS